MPGWLKWTLGGLAALGGFLVLAMGGGYLWLRGSIPQIEGEIIVAGLEAPVEVLRDSDGLVTIRAENDHDATLALGYVHAQDRLAQMDFMRRMGTGRLSELLGESTANLDRSTPSSPTPGDRCPWSSRCSAIHPSPGARPTA
jgi:penicillin amidase